jgi:hypothetical protein
VEIKVEKDGLSRLATLDRRSMHALSLRSGYTHGPDIKKGFKGLNSSLSTVTFFYQQVMMEQLKFGMSLIIEDV